MMKLKISVIALSLTMLNCCGIKRTVDSDAAKDMNSSTSTDLKKHLYIVASDEMEGRETGSEGQKKAGRYLIGEYQAYGISFPKGAKDFYQHVPAAYLNKKYNENLP